MDETNAKRKEKNAEKPSKKAEENAPLVNEAYTVLGTETKVASDVAEAMGINVQKASYLLRTLVAEGRATVEEIKVPKRGTVKAYTAVIAE
jgi:predicted ArsR family transcriptional regulator